MPRASRPRLASALSFAALLFVGLATPGRALVYVFENTTTGAVNFSATAANAAGCAAPLARTFAVANTLTITDVAVGLNVSHANRGDLRVTLVAPNGTTFLLLTPGGAADTNDNYDITLSSNAEDALADADLDPTAAPFFNRLAPVAALATSFDATPSSGNWTLNVCDITNNAVNGTFNQARLTLVTAATVPAECTGTTLFDWAIGTDGAAVPAAGLSVAGVTITQASTVDYLPAGSFNSRSWLISAPGVWAANEVPQGNDNSFYSMAMDGPNPSDNETLGENATFALSPPVKNFRFSLLDVDASAGGWEDLMLVRGFDSVGNVLPFTMTNSVQNQAAGNLAEGDTPSAGGNTTAGNVTYSFQGDLASVLVEYTQGTDPASDQAFQIIGIGDFTFCAFDYGDGPATYNVNVAAVSDPARHAMTSTRNVFLGAVAPDVETGAQVSAGAALDDTSQVEGTDDEDGVTTFPSFNPATSTYTVSVRATNSSGVNASIVAYIDWNRDGDFNDANEVSATVVVPTGSNNTAFNVTWSSVPANAGGTTATFARFRIATLAPTSPTGLANNGEVEDYLIAAGTLPVTVARVETVRSGSSLNVRWTTATETSNAGFRIWGVDSKGRRTVLGSVRSQRADSFAPLHYEVDLAASAATAAVEIEDLSLFGDRRRHGPFAVGKTFGEDLAPATLDWTAIKAEAGVVSAVDRMTAAEAGTPLTALQRVAAAASSNGGPVDAGLLLVREEGIHRVTHEQLLAAGVDLDGAVPANIALVDNGVAIPRLVTTAGPFFGAGSFIEFVARPQLTLASPVDAIVLRANAPKQALAPGRMAPRGTALGSVRADDAHEADSIYSFAAPNGDPWYEQDLLAWGGPASLSRTFDLPNLWRGAATIELRAWGYGDFPGAEPDHHVVVRVNGTQVADDRFDGVTPWSRTLDVSGLVSASGNLLEVEVPGDTGFDYDYLAFDGFTVSYTRQAVALGQRFRGASTAAGGMLVGGFAEGAVVSVWKLTAPDAAGESVAERRQQPAAADGTVSVGSAGAIYAAAPAGLYTPAVVAGVPAAKRSSTAEYVIVTHPALASSLGGLLALEQGRGLSAEVVTTDSIFAAYSDHVSSPAALKAFLRASLAGGNLRYVLLVGADTTDPWDHLGVGSVSYVPTEYVPFAQYIAFSPTDERLVDADGDGVADVPIGRLPVRTPSEVEAVVTKLQSWEHNLPSAAKSALLVAGASDTAGELAAVNQGYQQALSTWGTSLAQVDAIGAAATRQAVLDGLNGGTALVSFVGHSSPGQWDFTPLLRWSDAASLNNAAQPSLVAQWGCWNSYYVEPSYQSLSAHLLRAPGGAAGTIGASSLLSQASQELLGRLFFARVDGGAGTVGAALQGAKRDLLLLGNAQDVVLGTTLLGDPAMSLPPRSP